MTPTPRLGLLRVNRKAKLNPAHTNQACLKEPPDSVRGAMFITSIEVRAGQIDETAGRVRSGGDATSRADFDAPKSPLILQRQSSSKKFYPKGNKLRE